MERDQVRELARRIVDEAAPDQARSFDTHADAWFDDPARARSGDAIRNDPLGNGLAALIPNLVPLALTVSEHVLSVVKYTVDHIPDAAADLALEEATRRGFRLLRKRKKAEPEPTAAIPSQPLDASAVLGAYDGDLTKVREAAVAGGIKFGVDPEQARMIAEVVVTVLSSSTPELPASSE